MDEINAQRTKYKEDKKKLSAFKKILRTRCLHDSKTKCVEKIKGTKWSVSE